jgi:hypothetical protein
MRVLQLVGEHLLLLLERVLVALLLQSQRSGELGVEPLAQLNSEKLLHLPALFSVRAEQVLQLLLVSLIL